jgi:hypothetical protein
VKQSKDEVKQSEVTPHNQEKCVYECEMLILTLQKNKSGGTEVLLFLNSISGARMGRKGGLWLPCCVQ